jgi:predicted PurR-regulated permease PerM
MSLAITATVVGVVAAGLAIGTTVNSLANGSPSTPANAPAGNGLTIGDLLQQQSALTAETNDELQTLNSSVATQSQTLTTAITDAEYVAMAGAAVALVCVLFLHHKKR